MRLNPFQKISFNKDSVSTKKETYSYFVLTGLTDIQAKEGVLTALNSLDIDYKYSLFLTRPSETSGLEAIQEHIKSIQYQLTRESEGEESIEGIVSGIMNIPGNGVKIIKQRVGGTSQNQLLKELEQSENLEYLLDTKVESVYDFSLVVRIKIRKDQKPRKLIAKIERAFEHYNVNLPAGYYIQDKLYKIATFQKGMPSEFKFKTTIDNIAAFDPFWLSVSTITENSLLIGSTVEGDVLQFIDYFINIALANHIVVSGATGNGKSLFCKTLLWQLYRRGYNLIVLDPHGEYAPICDKMDCYTLSLSDEKGIDAFDLDNYDSLTVITSIAKSLIEAVSLTTLSDTQVGQLNDILHDAKEAKGDKYEAFIHLLEQNKYLKVYANALKKERLAKLLTDKSNKIQMDKKVVRVSFAGIPDNELSLFVSIVTQVIGHTMKDPQKPTLLLVDEGSKFLKDGNGTDKVVQSWFQEMRKMNTAVCLISQSLAEYGVTAKIIWENSRHRFSFAQQECENIKLPDDTWERIAALAPYRMCYSYRDNNGIDQNTIVKTIAPKNIESLIKNELN